MNFISIGGWCGTKIALKNLGLFNEPSLPFDSVRTSIEGIIDCIDNDFQNFFPKEIIKDNRFPNWIGFVGEYVGFYHHNHKIKTWMLLPGYIFLLPLINCFLLLLSIGYSPRWKDRLIVN